MVPKAFKEVKQQVDIVGKGRGDHGDSSWKGFAVFSRRTCHYRLCQVIYAHPSIKCHVQSTSQRDISPQKTTLSSGELFQPAEDMAEKRGVLISQNTMRNNQTPLPSLRAMTNN